MKTTNKAKAYQNSTFVKVFVKHKKLVRRDSFEFGIVFKPQQVLEQVEVGGRVVVQNSDPVEILEVSSFFEDFNNPWRKRRVVFKPQLH